MKGRLSRLAEAVLAPGLGACHPCSRFMSQHRRSKSPEETFTGKITRNPQIDHDVVN
jgi:hypothetical protein